jgi:hypothetical protein
MSTLCTTASTGTKIWTTQVNTVSLTTRLIDIGKTQDPIVTLYKQG